MNGTAQALLEIRDLRVRFHGPDGPAEALRGIDLAMGREKLGLVGASGSGKSCAARAILRLLPERAEVEAERLVFAGIDLARLPERAMRGIRGRRIALVAQDPRFSLDPMLCIGEQIGEAYLAHFAAGRDEARRRSLAMLEAVRIRDPERMLRAYPHQLSGGMGQRVAIAMALIAEPDLLIADEACSALDATVQMQVLALLDELVRRRGMGLLFISHDPGVVAAFCERVIVLAEGRVAEAGTAPRPGPTRPAALPVAALRHRGSSGQAAAAALALDNLSVAFGRGPAPMRAVDGVSLRVAEGETCGIAGESGSGKSTVLRVLAGLNEAWSGALRLFGRTVARRRPRALRRLVQMVFQDPTGSLHPGRTVDATLREGLIVQGMDDPDRRISRVLDEVGLGQGFRFRYPHQMSGGQRQRVAIARALVLEPRILLLDEPTSALDAAAQEEILDLLSRLRRERRLTAVLVSHNLAVLARLCDAVAVMNNGRIVEQLSPDALAAGSAEHPYTRQLLRAARGYDPGAAAEFVLYE